MRSGKLHWLLTLHMLAVCGVEAGNRDARSAHHDNTTYVYVLKCSVARSLFDRMKEQVWWRAMPKYSLLPCTHALAHSPAAAPDTAAYYTNTINRLRDTSPAYVKRVRQYFINASTKDER